MTEIVRTMAARHIYSDPTMVAFESLYVPDNGDLSPSYAPFIGTLPPALSSVVFAREDLLFPRI